MNPLSIFFTIFWLSCTYASFHQGGAGYQLFGVPDLESYGKLEYPKYDLIELGNIVHGEIPPKTVKVLKTISYKVPQPYPVKVPYKVPYPVHIEKPYPVVETKFIKISHPVPFPVIKEVPVPLEVPKPYPVPADEYKPPAQEAASQGWAGASSFGGSYQGGGESSQGGLDQFQSYGVPGQEAGAPLGASDYQSSFGGAEQQSQDYGGQEEEGHGLEDRSSSYSASDNQEQNNEEEQEH